VRIRWVGIYPATTGVVFQKPSNAIDTVDVSTLSAEDEAVRVYWEPIKGGEDDPALGAVVLLIDPEGREVTRSAGAQHGWTPPGDVSLSFVTILAGAFKQPGTYDIEIRAWRPMGATGEGTYPEPTGDRVLAKLPLTVIRPE
jgi:hypothetical protein